MANIKDIPGEQYCMNCSFWGRLSNGRVGCSHSKAKKCWFANQLNGCDFFDGELEPKKDWSKAYLANYRPSTFRKI
jgi:hypothetical protein